MGKFKEVGVSNSAKLRFIALGVGILVASADFQASATETSPLDPDIPLARRPRDEFSNDGYRYDFSERHLTFGVDLGGALNRGSTLNAFPFGGLLTPYFRGAFGDGNALEVDLTFGMTPARGANAEWLFYRTPIEEGATVSGYVGFLAPTICFRYEIGLTASIAHRATVLSWAGIGMGPAFIKGDASLTNNGTQPDNDVNTFEVFYDVVPTFGFRVRVTEFAFLQFGARLHLLWVIGAKVNDASEMTFGMPEVIPEFWIGNSRVYDLFLGFGYDFG